MINGLLRWGALALAACSLSACVVYPVGHYHRDYHRDYRRDRYYAPPPPPPRYYHRGWGATDPVAPSQGLAASRGSIRTTALTTLDRC